MENQIKILGYDLLGQQESEGIRYVWKNDTTPFLLESASFINKTKGKKEDISGYTTSVSMGCVLKSVGYACKFCRTGAKLPYSGMLSAYEIAKQNVFMVLMDLEYAYNGNLINNQREFAYMGQGEPGYSYAQLKLAIKLTDYVMNMLGQKVHRHIISTSGIPEMIYAVSEDVKNKYFDSRITLHFSLHTTSIRDELMPINKKYPYDDVLNYLKKFSMITGEKVCIGFLLLNEFSNKNREFIYTTSIDEIEMLLNKIDDKYFRLSLCEFNSSSDVGNCKPFEQEEAKRIFQYIREKGYEVKVFSSFGKENNAACGMLGGQSPQILIDEKIISLEEYSESLIREAYMHV